jgi:hypothetical protein
VHQHGARFDLERAGQFVQLGQMGLVGQVGSVQQEDVFVAGGGIEPGEGQRRVGGFEGGAVVADLDDEKDAGFRCFLASRRMMRVKSRPSSPEPSASSGSCRYSGGSAATDSALT